MPERGLYKQPLGAGHHDITCPWLAGHTDGIDHSTAYFKPYEGFPLGGFKCQHSHCTDRHIRALLDVLDIDVAAARMVPSIRIIAGELHRVADAAESALAHTGRFYQCGGAIVTVTTDPGTRRTAPSAGSNARRCCGLCRLPPTGNALMAAALPSSAATRRSASPTS